MNWTANPSAGWWVGRAWSLIHSISSGNCAKARGNFWAANSLTTPFPMSPFGESLAKLARAGVRYVLVGGAVLLHGHARTTGGIALGNRDGVRVDLDAMRPEPPASTDRH